MNNGDPFWKRVEAYPLWRTMLYAFLFALSARLLVTVIFFLRWGFHSAGGIELWYYYGVAKGTFDLYSVWDPSWWILRALGALFPGEALLSSVHCAASLTSSLNAALFCLLVSKLHDKRTGLLAGLIYGSMAQPIFNSAATVTHDVFAYPFLILSLLGAVMLFKSTGRARLLFAGVCLCSLFIGAHIGPAVLVAAGALCVFLAWQGVKALACPGARGGQIAFAVYLAGIIAAAIIVYYFVMPGLMEKVYDLAMATRGVDVRAQIKAGAGDLLPASPGDYWLRFNFLLFFLPIGLYMAFKKGDALCWGLVVCGFLASLAADRGTRFLAFGVALTGALAFIDWRTIYGWVLAAVMGLAVGFLGGEYNPVYAVVFPVAALLVYCFIQWPRGDEKPAWCLVFLSLCLLWLIAGCLLGWGAQKAAVAMGDMVAGRSKVMRASQAFSLVPVVLLLLDAWSRRTREKRGRRWPRHAAYTAAFFALSLCITCVFALKSAGGWHLLYLVFPLIAAAAVLALAWHRRGEASRRCFAGVAAVLWLFAVVIPSLNLAPSSSEEEYRLYRWLSEHAHAGGKVFVPWNKGFMAHAVSGLTPAITPNDIDFDLPRIYWLTEGEAAGELRRRGIEHIVVSTAFFKITRYSKEIGAFQYGGSGEAVYHPGQMGITDLDTLGETALAKLLYRPREVREFQLLRVEQDRAGERAYLVYRVLPRPDS